MARDTDLLRRLELFGLTVTEVDGWRTRGADTLAIKGSVGHHTGGAAKGVQPSLGVVINGRSDLVGPLCNVHGPREETRRVNLVAAGRANHAGVGHWGGITGNSSVGGLEEEHTGGPNEPISSLRVERFCRVHAAFVYGKATADAVCMHWEWATPAGRKVDFVKSLIHADYLRQRVGQLLANPNLPWPGDPVIKETPVHLAIPDSPHPEAGKLFLVSMDGGMRQPITDNAVRDSWAAKVGQAVHYTAAEWQMIIDGSATSMFGLRSLPNSEGGQGVILGQIHDAVVKAR